MKSSIPEATSVVSQPILPEVESSGWRRVAIGLACLSLGLLVAAGYLAGRLTTPVAELAGHPFPSTIDAVGSASDDKFSVATGVVSEQAEGFFVLDHNSGIVQCHVYYPRNGQFLASFTGNVGEMLGGGKGARYLMVTGQTDMTRGARSMSLSPTLLYVLNTTNGTYGVFAVPFDHQALSQGRPQAGLLLPMGKGTTNLIPVR